jgi:hypothetical protein
MLWRMMANHQLAFLESSRSVNASPPFISVETSVSTNSVSFRTRQPKALSRLGAELAHGFGSP